MKRTLEDRFWAKVHKHKIAECWPWIGYKEPRGYGILLVNRKLKIASRVSYEIAKGPIPHDMCVCHACDNPSCVNPAHLFLGTREDNNRDRDTKKRHARGVRHGFALHPEAVARGERASKAKLTAEQVAEIRKRYAAGGIALRAIGAEYGISHTAARHIVVRKNWWHI